MSDKSTAASGIGAVGLVAAGLTIVFAIFKLNGTLDWSWLQVTAPIWIYVGVQLALVALILLFVFVAWVATKIFD